MWGNYTPSLHTTFLLLMEGTLTIISNHYYKIRYIVISHHHSSEIFIHLKYVINYFCHQVWHMSQLTVRALVPLDFEKHPWYQLQLRSLRRGILGIREGWTHWEGARSHPQLSTCLQKSKEILIIFIILFNLNMWNLTICF